MLIIDLRPQTMNRGRGDGEKTHYELCTFKSGKYPCSEPVRHSIRLSQRICDKVTHIVQPAIHLYGPRSQLLDDAGSPMVYYGVWPCHTGDAQGAREASQDYYWYNCVGLAVC